MRGQRVRRACPPHRREGRTAAAVCRRRAGLRAEPARPAQQLAVPIEFVAVLDEGRPEDVPRRASGRYGHRAPVPGVAVITGMTVRHPTADVIGQTHVAVVAARQGGQIDRLPVAIVCIGGRPARIIAGMESPGAIEQSRCGTQRRRIRAAAARQVGDHDGEYQQRRDDDADDQFALCWVDRSRRRRYRFGHHAMISSSGYSTSANRFKVNS